MNAPEHPRAHRQQALEQAGLDAVGALSPAESVGWFREHCAQGCAICTAAVAEVAQLFEQLLLAAPPIQAPPAVRARLLAAVRADGAREAAPPAPAAEEIPAEEIPAEEIPAEEIPAEEIPAEEIPAEEIQVWKRWTTTEPSKFHIVPSSQGWQPTAVPGIDVRALHVDEARDAVTMLIRMAPGTSYPRHRHGGDEECFVIRGVLKIEDHVLRAGDYQFAPRGSIHGVQSTDEGCMLLIVSSRHDELLT
jgi:quercetin dioxygenase-like cupin family protein